MPDLGKMDIMMSIIDTSRNSISPIAHRIGKNAIRIAIPEILCRPFIGNPLFMHIAYHINV